MSERNLSPSTPPRNPACRIDILKDLPAGRPLLGVDWGEKRIGVAVSDSLHSFSSPLQTRQRKEGETLAESVKDLISERDIAAVVIGFPLQMDGEEGAAAKKVRAESEHLAEAFALPVLMWDERLSSQAAQRSLSEAGLKNRKKREFIDRSAAAHILQSVLDALSFSP